MRPHVPPLTSFWARLLRLEMLVATALLGIAILWQAWRPVGLWQALSWSAWWLPAGLVAAVPPLSVILLLESPLATRLYGLRVLRHNIESFLVPLLGDLRWVDRVGLALLAGLSEEVFFRGVLQAEVGLVAASVAFGLLHMVSLPYALWATLVGFYLGWLLHLTQTLWVPIVAHTVIDFVGLCYIRFIVQPRCAEVSSQTATTGPSLE